MCKNRAGSLLVTMFMHGSLTASARILMPLEISGVSLLTFDLVWVAVLCVFIAAIAVANGWHLSGQPLRTRAA